MKRDSAVANRKLTSLLALSAGAVAAPGVAEAGIVYSGVINQKVGFSVGFGSEYLMDLPGSSNLRLNIDTNTTASETRWRVIMGQWGGYARLRRYTTGDPWSQFARLRPAGWTWDANTGGIEADAIIGSRWHNYISVHAVGGPGSFDDRYVAFKFQDSTQGNADRYGWALLSMSVDGSPSPVGPDVTLHSWAYDDTGAKIATGNIGAVPEPSSATLMALGALTLGSRGLRRWRSRKQETAAR